MEDKKHKDDETKSADPGNTFPGEGHRDEHKKKKKKEQVPDECDRLLEEKGKIIADLENDVRKLHEQTLYMQAEFENFKKRNIREKEENLKYANEKLIKDLLPVIDNLERALNHAGEPGSAKNISEGIQLTLNDLFKVLEKAGLNRIEAIGKVFDPTYHEALLQEDRDDIDPDLVVSEFEKGYILNGRLLRPSKVSVSRKPDNE